DVLRARDGARLSADDVEDRRHRHLPRGSAPLGRGHRAHWPRQRRLPRHRVAPHRVDSRRAHLEPLHRPPPGHRVATVARDDPRAERAEAPERAGGAMDPPRRPDRARSRPPDVLSRVSARTTPCGPGGLWLKPEDEHELGAFKWRGALAVLEAKRPGRVVTASTGNHGAAT